MKSIDAVAQIDDPLTGLSSAVVRGDIVDRVRDMIAGWCELGGDLRNAVLIIHPKTIRELTGICGEHRLVVLCGLPVVTDPKCQLGDVWIEAAS